MRRTMRGADCPRVHWEEPQQARNLTRAGWEDVQQAAERWFDDTGD